MASSEERLAELGHEVLHLVRLWFEVPLVPDRHGFSDGIDSNNERPLGGDDGGLPENYRAFREGEHAEQNDQPAQGGISSRGRPEARVEGAKLAVNFRVSWCFGGHK